MKRCDLFSQPFQIEIPIVNSMQDNWIRIEDGEDVLGSITDSNPTSSSDLRKAIEMQYAAFWIELLKNIWYTLAFIWDTTERMWS